MGLLYFTLFSGHEAEGEVSHVCWVVWYIWLRSQGQREVYPVTGLSETGVDFGRGMLVEMKPKFLRLRDKTLCWGLGGEGNTHFVEMGLKDTHFGGCAGRQNPFWLWAENNSVRGLMISIQIFTH